MIGEQSDASKNRLKKFAIRNAKFVQGAFRIGAALSTRMDGWGMLLLSGIITLVLGLMIWNEWPLSGIWVIGLFVGIDLIFYGWWLVSLALSVRHLAKA